MAALAVQDNVQVLAGLCIVRIYFQRFPVLPDGFIWFPLFIQRVAEIVTGLREIRLNF